MTSLRHRTHRNKAVTECRSSLSSFQLKVKFHSLPLKELNDNSGAPDLRRGLDLLSNTWGVALKILLALVKIKWKKIVLDC
ncbi:hypothetical protein TNCV_5118601 [Trichonephila clavipes]|nr:hypothetical protein TNCV_5118601 [Trichonephila clavipes]